MIYIRRLNISFIVISALALGGCGLSPFQQEASISDKSSNVANQPVCLSADGMLSDCKNSSVLVSNDYTSVSSNLVVNTNVGNTSRPYLHSLAHARSSVMLGEYIEQLSMDLIGNLKSSNGIPLVGVTSIVEVSSNLSTITPLSNVITEEFITELQHKNIYVVDYKITNSITVSPYGEFVFYRNSVEELSEDKINHVLAGTLTYTKQGIIVNARVVEFESKKVISSAKKLIPYFVFDSVITG